VFYIGVGGRATGGVSGLHWMGPRCTVWDGCMVKWRSGV